MHPERRLTVQRFQCFQPFHAGLGRFPAVRRHAEEGLDIRLTFQMEREVHRDDIRVSEALIRSFLFLVGIGGVVENLLQLPQVPRPRHHIEEIPAGLQNAAEFVNGQRGEAVQQNVCGPIREGQVIGRRPLQIRCSYSAWQPAAE